MQPRSSPRLPSGQFLRRVPVTSSTEAYTRKDLYASHVQLPVLQVPSIAERVTSLSKSPLVMASRTGSGGEVIEKVF